MKLHRLFGTSLLLIAAVAFATGCGTEGTDLLGADDDNISGEYSMSELDLNKQYGGLAYTNEDVAFGDDVLLAEEALDAIEAADDDEAGLLDEEDPSDYTRTYLRVMWGQMDGRPDGDELRDEVRDCEPLDWQGNLTVSDGALALKRFIKFERPLDHRVPRDSRQTVGWHSYTCPHVDGVLVAVLSKPAEDGSLPGEITFTTGPLTQSFAIADLDGLDETIAVDDAGNAVSFLGFTDLPERCPSGFLGGYWQKHANDEHGGGVFRGTIGTKAGGIRAHLMGRFGVNDEGQNVFAGKIINRDGDILGLIQGTYESNDDADGTGTFMGRWVNQNETHMGVLKGRYRSIPDRGAGFFHGVWEEICKDDESDGGDA